MSSRLGPLWLWYDWWYGGHSASKEWELSGVIVVHIPRSGLNAIGASSEYPIPQASLLAVVVGLLPAFAMMKVVVFNYELGVENP
jgi:hypothetical protein